MLKVEVDLQLILLLLSKYFIPLAKYKEKRGKNLFKPSLSLCKVPINCFDLGIGSLMKSAKLEI